MLTKQYLIKEVNHNITTKKEKGKDRKKETLRSTCSKTNTDKYTLTSN